MAINFTSPTILTLVWGDGGAYSSSSGHEHFVLTFTSDFLQLTKDSLPTHLAL